MKNINFSFLMIFLMLQSGFAQESFALWPEGIPNHQTSEEKEMVERGDITWIRKVQKPSIQVFLPSQQNATGQALLICPGGGYEGLAYDWEGTDIAKFLNSMGVAGIVLKYRLPNSASLKKPNEAPLEDARRAMKMIRQHAKNWNIDPNKLGVIGFSAGGHLASTLGTHLQKEPPVSDEISKQNALPNFMALIYPVISMKNNVTHLGSRDALLGKNPSEKMILKYSNETMVSKDTPTTFLVHAQDDKVVPVKNSLLFYQALNEKNIPAELHIYPMGGHGFSLAIGKYYLSSWPQRLADWLQNMNYFIQ